MTRRASDRPLPDAPIADADQPPPAIPFNEPGYSPRSRDTSLADARAAQIPSAFNRSPSPPGHLSTALLFVALLVAPAAHGFNFSFPFPGSSERDNQPPGPWQYRPQQPGNARGTPPGYQPPPAQPSQMPGQAPGYQPPVTGYRRGWPGQYQTPYAQQPGRGTEKPPRIELELSDHKPYVQENLLLRLRVISNQNLKTATPELPNSNDVLLQKIQGPEARSRTAPQGEREIVNEFVYTLTPLRAGNMEVPPLRVTGTFYGSGNGYGYAQAAGQRYEATSSEPLRLQVRPAMASVRPWLPLQDLSLKATLDGGEEVEQGQPVTLVLELSAAGATGSQLPSLEPLLSSPDFRVYREQTLSEGQLSADGRHLNGTRTEYFTLVPRSGGKLQLPEIRVPWWNVDTGTKEYAGLPIRTLQVDGDTGPFGLSRSADASGGGGLSWFWMPPAALVLLLLGYWAGVWYQRRPRGMAPKAALRQRLGSSLSGAAATARSRASDILRRMDPSPLPRRIGLRLSHALPPSSRFLACVRTANREQEPAAWAQRFADLTCHQLEFDSQASLPGVAGKILALRPGADPEQLCSLMQQLDGALYGNQDIDFKRWKRQFASQIGRRRGILRASGKGLHLSRARLPELNPRTSG